MDVVELREFAENRYRQCDDYPYGGGSGMVLMPGPLFRAISSVRGENTKVILTSASGELLTQDLVKRLAGEKEICIVCGHYEGVDQRVVDRYVDYEVSVGDYVLSGGEYAALILLDAVARYIPGFMSNSDSLVEESFEDGLLEYPQYTRPAEIEGSRCRRCSSAGTMPEYEDGVTISGSRKPEGFGPICISDIAKERIKEKNDEYTGSRPKRNHAARSSAELRGRRHRQGAL